MARVSLIIAAIAGRDVTYFTFGNEELKANLEAIVGSVEDQGTCRGGAAHTGRAA
jgi:hypothetical protein